jgi:hypothetical protein
MDNPLPILDHHTPRQYANSGNADNEREVLTILARLDYGMFS